MKPLHEEQKKVDQQQHLPMQQECVICQALDLQLEATTERIHQTQMQIELRSIVTNEKSLVEMEERHVVQCKKA